MRAEDFSEPLNPESQVLAEELSQRFPEWRDFADVHRGEAHYELEPGSLTVELASPVAGRNHRLGVQHRGDTFEVFYSDGEPPGPAEAQYIFAPGEERRAAAGAVQLMADVVEERVVTVRERIGRFLWLQPTSQLRFMRREELTERHRRRLVTVASWRSTFDETLEQNSGTR
jgi:hypothetical protein